MYSVCSKTQDNSKRLSTRRIHHYHLKWTFRFLDPRVKNESFKKLEDFVELEAVIDKGIRKVEEVCSEGEAKLQSGDRGAGQKSCTGAAITAPTSIDSHHVNGSERKGEA